MKSYTMQRRAVITTTWYGTYVWYTTGPWSPGHCSSPRPWYRGKAKQPVIRGLFLFGAEHRNLCGGRFPCSGTLPLLRDEKPDHWATGVRSAITGVQEKKRVRETLHRNCSPPFPPIHLTNHPPPSYESSPFAYSLIRYILRRDILGLGPTFLVIGHDVGCFYEGWEVLAGIG